MREVALCPTCPTRSFPPPTWLAWQVPVHRSPGSLTCWKCRGRDGRSGWLGARSTGPGVLSAHVHRGVLVARGALCLRACGKGFGSCRTKGSGWRTPPPPGPPQTLWGNCLTAGPGGRRVLGIVLPTGDQDHTAADRPHRPRMGQSSSTTQTGDRRDDPPGGILE